MLEKISLRSGLIVPIVDGTKNIEHFLTRRTRNYQGSEYISTSFFLKNDSHILVPRYFPINDFISNCEIKDERPSGEDIKLTTNIVPRNQLQKDAIDFMLNNDKGIIQLQPGSGKTVISIFVIATRKKKTLILVHRDSLVEQWKERFHQFTDLPDDEVVRLTSANVSSAFDSSIIIATNQTIISMLDRKRKEILTGLKNANIGIFIGDEVHTTVGAPSFSECSIHIPSRVTFGLSATPYRWDKNEDIINFHLGDIYSDTSTADTMSANVLFILFDYGIARKSSTYIYWGREFQRSRYLNLIRKSEIFMNIIKEILRKVKNGRDSIIVCERIKLIEYLHKWLHSDSKSMFIKSAKNEILKARNVFATPGKIRDGVDIPKKDCLILTSPISNIEQMSGRICRSLKNKQQPIIIDMVDIGCREIRSTIYKRINFYSARDWKMKFMYVTNSGEKIFIENSEIYDFLKGVK